MSAESALYTALSGSSAITTIVNTRIYSDVRDQGDIIPAIYYERTSTEFHHTLDDYAPDAQTANITLTCFQTTRELSDTLSGLIIVAAADASFLCTDKQNDFDEETQVYSTTLQLTYFS